MRVVLSRRFGTSVKFIAVLEFHQSGVAHLHVLLEVYIPQKWLSNAWQSIGGGRIVDIRFVDVQRVAGYLSAYLAGGKVEHTLLHLPRRARIFSCSRTISFWVKAKPSGWWVVPCSLERLRMLADYVRHERFESPDDPRRASGEVLLYFEALPIPEALYRQDQEKIMKALSLTKAERNPLPTSFPIVNFRSSCRMESDTRSTEP